MGFTYDAPPPEEEEKEDEWVDITLGVFLDGTLNNKTNTEARLEAETGGTDKAKLDAFNKNKKDSKSSYFNDYSNVARLWDFYDKNLGIYIEGIGTEDLQKDDTNGYAFGAGKTGVRGKVRKACEEVVEKIKKIASYKKVHTLTFDVFGFSRGATASRNFVYEVNRGECKSQKKIIHTNSMAPPIELKIDSDGYTVSESDLPAGGHLGLMLERKEIEVLNIKVRFLGIFDTVSSYHEGPLLLGNAVSYDFTNDEEELNLHAISSVARVVHFTARDEHRKNFALTKIHEMNSAENFKDYKGKLALEKTFPGVHCDIGGAYIDNEEETVQEIDYKMFGTEYLENERQRLVREGWYNEGQIAVKQRYLKYNYLTGTRTLSNKFSFIPLHFMCEFALDYNKPLPYKQAQLEDEYALKQGATTDSLLVDVKNRLKDYVFNDGKEPLVYKPIEEFDVEIAAYYKRTKFSNEEHGAYINNYFQEQEVLRKLRNGYLHWSANYKGFGMNPNLKDGEEPNFIEKKRTRETYLSKK